MQRSRFSDEQIIGILKEHEAGVSVADLCRKHGVSDARIYKWKAKFGGLEISEANGLRTPEDESTRLKRLLADAMLDNSATLAQARVAFGCWRADYGDSRTRSRLGRRTPAEFAFIFHPRRDLAPASSGRSTPQPTSPILRENSEMDKSWGNVTRYTRVFMTRSALNPAYLGRTSSSICAA
jgi:putative transposase